MVSIDETSAARVRDVSHLYHSAYRNLDVGGTLGFFQARYVEPLAARFDLGQCTVLDCACGYGWLAIAYVLNGGKRAIAVDLDAPRLRAAAEIAAILGVDDRVDFAIGSVTELPIADGGVDISISVETLEHLGGRAAGRRAVAELARIARRAVVLTTPNKLFPVVAHDTRLPLLHWLPPKRRRPLSTLLGREQSDAGNEFLTPADLSPLDREFRRVSRCLVFADFARYRQHFPFYLPYKNAREKWNTAPPAGQALYFRAVSLLFGTRSHWVMPNLASLYVRRQASEPARAT